MSDGLLEGSLVEAEGRREDEDGAGLVAPGVARVDLGQEAARAGQQAEDDVDRADVAVRAVGPESILGGGSGGFELGAAWVVGAPGGRVVDGVSPDARHRSDGVLEAEIAGDALEGEARTPQPGAIGLRRRSGVGSAEPRRPKAGGGGLAVELELFGGGDEGVEQALDFGFGSVIGAGG